MEELRLVASSDPPGGPRIITKRHSVKEKEKKKKKKTKTKIMGVNRASMGLIERRRVAPCEMRRLSVA